jgi:D-beta-D-heptose 7-phosphate kinase/D-beta-D-heptose 1-phosphate adenosyltransferase
MKIFSSIEELNRVLKQVAGKIVFTNGVFDLIHNGHIELLEFAKNLGDILIVGINDDESVRRLKGEARPIFPLAERLEILDVIEYVDYLIPFAQDTPKELIEELSRIDVLVKGGDYSAEEVVGREKVERDGGKLVLFQFKSDISSSKIFETIRKNHCI